MTACGSSPYFFQYLHVTCREGPPEHYVCCVCLVAQSCLTLCDPIDCSQVPLSMGILQARILQWVACLPPGEISNSGIESRSPALQVDSLPSKLPGKPKITEVGSLSLLQGDFPTQESNWGLLHCQQILYQLSYPGSLCTKDCTHPLIAFFFLFFL